MAELTQITDTDDEQVRSALQVLGEVPYASRVLDEISVERAVDIADQLRPFIDVGMLDLEERAKAPANYPYGNSCAKLAIHGLQLQGKCNLDNTDKQRILGLFESWVFHIA